MSIPLPDGSAAWQSYERDVQLPDGSVAWQCYRLQVDGRECRIFDMRRGPTGVFAALTVERWEGICRGEVVNHEIGRVWIDATGAWSVQMESRNSGSLQLTNKCLELIHKAR